MIRKTLCEIVLGLMCAINPAKAGELHISDYIYKTNKHSIDVIFNGLISNQRLIKINTIKISKVEKILFDKKYMFIKKGNNIDFIYINAGTKVHTNTLPLPDSYKNFIANDGYLAILTSDKIIIYNHYTNLIIQTISGKYNSMDLEGQQITMTDKNSLIYGNFVLGQFNEIASQRYDACFLLNEKIYAVNSDEIQVFQPEMYKESKKINLIEHRPYSKIFKGGEAIFGLGQKELDVFKDNSLLKRISHQNEISSAECKSGQIYVLYDNGKIKIK